MHTYIGTRHEKHGMTRADAGRRERRLGRPPAHGSARIAQVAQRGHRMLPAELQKPCHGTLAWAGPLYSYNALAAPGK